MLNSIYVRRGAQIHTRIGKLRDRRACVVINDGFFVLLVSVLNDRWASATVSSYHSSLRTPVDQDHVP